MEGTSKKGYHHGVEHTGILSFVTGNTEPISFGSVEIPKEIQWLFGKHLLVNIILVCKEGFHWKASYDKDKKAIVGLEDFLTCHEVKQQYILLFDYIGSNQFTIKIYNTNGMEIDYLTVKPHKCKSKITNALKEGEYVVGIDIIEEEKAKALIHFNGFRGGLRSYERKIKSLDIARMEEGLVLERGMLDLYSKWRDGDKIILLLLERWWEIEIEQNNELCCLGKGWLNFAQDTGLSEDDILICYTIYSRPEIHVCIIKKKEIVESSTKSEVILSGRKKMSTSFLHITHEESLDGHYVGVPLLFEKFFYKLLHGLHSVECGGIVWDYFYIKNSRRVAVFKLLNNFNIGPMYTLIFTCQTDDISNIRLFRKDGIEIRYDEIDFDKESGSTEWFMDRRRTLFYEKGEETDTDSESETEYGQILEAEGLAEWTFQFRVVLISCHVDLKSHGVYLPPEFENITQNWTNNQRFNFQTDRGTWVIGINHTNGRKRFSAGWNKFIRENGLKIGDALDFNFDEHDWRFVIQVTKHDANQILGD